MVKTRLNNKIFLEREPFREWESRNSSKMKVHCLLLKFTSCCIARDLRMLHIKIFISKAVQEIIQTNRIGEFAGLVQTKLPWIPEAYGFSLVAEHITVGRSLSQLFHMEPKHCVVKMGSPVKIWPITKYPRIGILASDWIPRGTRSRFSVFLGASGIQGKLADTYAVKSFTYNIYTI